ncbi:TetR/AcrR family transcriptional regulator [Cellulomonas sp. HZM]|uniref:TetR/AcrR family transcriptional regulator n=1 Tax=Cellulomonas sp. HZM TaxID=1454010 RepID=UPI00049301ED|nr:TetR/AcrR family transcriptional regulator [Cellulomonas sp. HZM]
MTETTVDAPEPLGLRERKKRARRLALIDATHRLVERDGLEAVTVEAICAAAGVSPRTFFNYFETKDDAVLGHVPWSMQGPAVDEFVAGGPTGHLLDDLAAVLEGVLLEPPLGRERMHAVLELASKEPRLLARHMTWVDQHKGQLVDLVERRLGPDPERDPQTVAVLAMHLTHATFLRWDAAGGAGTAHEHLTHVVAELRAVVVD